MLLCPDGPVCVLVKQKKSLIHQTDFLETCARDIHRSTGDAIEIGLDRPEIDGSIDRLPKADKSKAGPQLSPAMAGAAMNVIAANGVDNGAAHHAFVACDGALNHCP